MRARTRIAIFFGLLIPLAISNVSLAVAIDPELNATLAPGADGQSVTLSTSVRIPTSGTGGSTNQVNSKRVGPLVWLSYFVPVPAENQDGTCNPQTQSQNSNPEIVMGPSSETGLLKFGFLENRITGENVYETYYCQQINGATIPSYVPVPPTYAEIWNAIYSNAFNDQSISSGAYVAPASPGLTGLPTHIWAQFPGGQSISRDVSFAGGYRIRATVSIEEVSVILKTPKGNWLNLVNLKQNGQGQIDGGSYENPASIYEFKSSGEYKISTGIIWSAENATLTGPGINEISVPIGSIRIEINRNYEVQELKPALVK